MNFEKYTQTAVPLLQSVYNRVKEIGTDGDMSRLIRILDDTLTWEDSVLREIFINMISIGVDEYTADEILYCIDSLDLIYYNIFKDNNADKIGILVDVFTGYYDTYQDNKILIKFVNYLNELLINDGDVFAALSSKDIYSYLYYAKTVIL